jgi:uncharacterized repeat protein (TIGR01451 family)
MIEGGELDPYSFEVSPSGLTTVYIADQDTDEVFELYAATLIPGADLGIRKAVTPVGVITPGQPLTYTLTFSNTGDATATGIVISDTLPVELTDVAVKVSDVVLGQTGLVPYRWLVQDLATGEGGVITITGVISPTLGKDTIVTNKATISSDTPDDDGENNSSQASVLATATSHKVYLSLVLREW